MSASGSGASHRSGFHSFASGPHSAVFVLCPSTPMMISVPLGMGISLISVPSRPRMGEESGRTTSLIGLQIG